MDTIIKLASFSNSKNLNKNNKVTDRKELALATFKQANEFFKACDILLQSDLSLKSVIGSNLAFTIELYLKSILYKNNIDCSKEKHEILKLFKSLPEDIKNQIKSNLTFEYEDSNNIDLLLNEINDSFEFLRYSNEREAIVVQYDVLIGFVKTLNKVTTNLFK